MGKLLKIYMPSGSNHFYDRIPLIQLRVNYIREKHHSLKVFLSFRDEKKSKGGHDRKIHRLRQQSSVIFVQKIPKQLEWEQRYYHSATALGNPLPQLIDFSLNGVTFITKRGL